MHALVTEGVSQTKNQKTNTINGIKRSFKFLGKKINIHDKNKIIIVTLYQLTAIKCINQESIYAVSNSLEKDSLAQIKIQESK